MTIHALMFDLDGTLVRSNDAHVDAFLEAFDRCGYRVGRARIEAEIGKGGDLLVPAILGADVDEAHGDEIRSAHRDAFRARIEREGVQLYPGVDQLFDAVHARGLRTALATSASREDVELVERLIGRRFASMVDVIATKEDGAVSKPAPHILQAACAKLGEEPLACAMIGDSLHDAGAARRAGVAFIGVATGFVGEAAFYAEGARFTTPDLVRLTASLSEALAATFPSRVGFNGATLATMMDSALAAARKSLSLREVPIGAALFDRDGKLVASGHNRACETKDLTAHAAIDALRRLAERGIGLAEGATLVTTLEPCVMCFGAAMEVGVDAVVYGIKAPADSGTTRIAPLGGRESPLPRVRGGIAAGKARALFESWLRDVGTEAQRPYIEQILSETVD